MSAVVIGDGLEVFVERDLHELEGEDDFLRAVDEDQHVAKSGGVLKAFEASVESGDA